ncbi:hypothetical protein BGZ47_006003 [Haplosporangium gracile]|nr:hypothetical protein BGZ47_006003 [Haplosporangium gracile]
MPWNPLTTGAAVIVGVVTVPLMVTGISGALVAGSTVTFVVTSIAGPTAGVVSLSAAQTAIASVVGGVAAAIFSVITHGDEDRRRSHANTTEAIEEDEGFDAGNDGNIIHDTDAKEVIAFYRQQAGAAK